MNFFFSFIPRRINNKTIITVYEMLRKLQKLKKGPWQEHLSANQKAFANHAVFRL